MASDISLRSVIDSDLPIFFEQQLSPTANHMAAFTAEDPFDHDAFLAHWAKVRSDDSIVVRAILAHGEVAGSIVSYEQFGEREVGYWLGEAYWGQGIATQALRLFLEQIPIRPLYARAAKDNLASIRVLEKCGFITYGTDRGFSYTRSQEVDEALLKLDGPAPSATE